MSSAASINVSIGWECAGFGFSRPLSGLTAGPAGWTPGSVGFGDEGTAGVGVGSMGLYIDFNAAA